jgi:hypothetical protein
VRSGGFFIFKWVLFSPTHSRTLDLMTRVALIALMSLLFSGAPCLHHAFAMGNGALKTAPIHEAATVQENGHIHPCAPASATNDGVAIQQTDDDGICCIKNVPAGSEADDVTTQSDAALALTTNEVVSAIFDERRISQDYHPPDFQSPYHKRTTCRRE